MIRHAVFAAVAVVVSQIAPGKPVGAQEDKTLADVRAREWNAAHR